ncbi:MAG TPA: hypothetical protein VH595_01960 [Verrucomicrobiae bacterium]|jgi:hypothetical protein|nr:hypothetical protein [Verrucomicrobiae bacterium]
MVNEEAEALALSQRMAAKQYRAELPAWIFIGGLSAFPWLIVWADAVHGIPLAGVLVAGIVSGYSFAWLVSFKIVITPAELVFRSLFRGKQSIKHNQIKIVRLEWKAQKGPLRLVVEPKESNGARKLDINAKVFSRAAIDAVLELGSRVAKADDGGLRDGIVLKSWRSWRGRPNPKTNK